MLLAGFLSCSKDEEPEVTPPVNIGCEFNQPQKEMIDIMDNSVAFPFLSSDPSVNESNNLDPLLDYLGEVEFVGLGEAIHGTAEFFEMKDKIFRGLVEKKGFKAIIFELPWGNALKVNEAL